MSDDRPDVPEVTSATLMDALRRVHAVSTGAEAYAVMSEVRDRTGYAGSSRNRYADFLAVGLWPSRGMEIEGFEVKDHRSDWLREMKEPAKADAIFRFCDRWWLVSAPDVAKAEEVPSCWGWLEWVPAKKGEGGKLRTRKPAPKLEPVEPTRGFLASLLRSLARAESFEHALAEARRQARSEGRQEVREEWDAHEARQLATKGDEPDSPKARRQRERLERLDRFERETGINLSYEHEPGARVKAAMDLAWALDGKRQAVRADLVASARKVCAAVAGLDRLRKLADEKKSEVTP